jgi:hypothetical protein
MGEGHPVGEHHDGLKGVAALQARFASRCSRWTSGSRPPRCRPAIAPISRAIAGTRFRTSERETARSSMCSIAIATKRLRRPHDHHRDLRARRNATASANRSADPHQNRQLMISPRFRRDTRSARRFSSGHGTARPDIQRSHQIAQSLATFVTTRRSFRTRYTVCRLAPLRRLPSAAVRAAPKSP